MQCSQRVAICGRSLMKISQNACMNNNIMLEAPTEKDKDTASKDETRSLARQDSKARWEDGWMFPRKWMLPSLQAPLKDFDLFKSKDSEVIRVKEDDNKMEVSLDTAQYRPDELKITVEEGVVCVEEDMRRRQRTEARWSAGASLGSTPCPEEQT